MDFHWGMEVASTDRWIGKLGGALSEPQSGRVVYLVVKQGMIFRREIVISLERVSRCDPEGIYLDVPFDQISTVPKIYHEQLAKLTSETTISLSDGEHTRVKGIRINQDDHTLTDFVISDTGQRRVLLSKSEVVWESAGHFSANVSKSELDALSTYRADEGIRDDIWESLYETDDVSKVDLKGVDIRLEDGVAALQGNVRTASAVEAIENAVSEIEGVVAIHNQLYNDWNLQLTLATRLSTHDAALAEVVAIHIQLGNVTLVGYTPSIEAKKSLIEEARAVAGVVSVQDELQIRTPLPADASEPQAETDSGGSDQVLAATDAEPNNTEYRENSE